MDSAQMWMCEHTCTRVRAHTHTHTYTNTTTTTHTTHAIHTEIKLNLHIALIICCWSDNWITFPDHSFVSCEFF